MSFHTAHCARVLLDWNALKHTNALRSNGQRGNCILSFERNLSADKALASDAQEIVPNLLDVGPWLPRCVCVCVCTRGTRWQQDKGKHATTEHGCGVCDCCSTVVAIDWIHANVSNQFRSACGFIEIRIMYIDSEYTDIHWCSNKAKLRFSVNWKNDSNNNNGRNSDYTRTLARTRTYIGIASDRWFCRYTYTAEHWLFIHNKMCEKKQQNMFIFKLAESSSHIVTHSRTRTRTRTCSHSTTRA